MKAEIFAGLPKKQQFEVREYIGHGKVDFIIGISCKHFGIDREDMVGGCRKRDLVDPRHITQYLCWRHSHQTLIHIGKKFSGRKNAHCNVIHARDKVEEIMSYDDEFKRVVEDLEKKVKKELSLT